MRLQALPGAAQLITGAMLSSCTVMLSALLEEPATSVAQ